VRETAARTFGQILPNPDVAAAALRGLLEQRHTVPERRAAAAGLLGLVRLLSQLATGSGTAPKPDIKDTISTSQAVVSAASLGLADPDLEVRRLCAEAIYQAATVLPDKAPHP